MEEGKQEPARNKWNGERRNVDFSRKTAQIRTVETAKDTRNSPIQKIHGSKDGIRAPKEKKGECGNRELQTRPFVESGDFAIFTARDRAQGRIVISKAAITEPARARDMHTRRTPHVRLSFLFLQIRL